MRCSASKRILRFLKRRGVITLVTAPGDSEITVVTNETMGEKDPLLARLLAAATAGVSPAGPAHKRAPVPIVLDPDATPVAKGKLCGQQAGFNLHGQTKVAANDKKGRENLCKYILRPPLASRVGSRTALPAANHRGKVWKPSQGFHVDDRLKILDDGDVRLEFKRPWPDGTYALDMDALALLARLASAVPPPKQHLTRYSGVLAAAAHWRPLIIPLIPAAPADPSASAAPEPPPPSTPAQPAFTKPSKPPPSGTRCRYIRWAELLRLTFGLTLDKCPACGGRMKLRALVRDTVSIERFLRHQGLWSPPENIAPARAPPYHRKVTRLSPTRQQELFPEA